MAPPFGATGATGASTLAPILRTTIARFGGEPGQISVDAGDDSCDLLLANVDSSIDRQSRWKDLRSPTTMDFAYTRECSESTYEVTQCQIY